MLKIWLLYILCNFVEILSDITLWEIANNIGDVTGLGLRLGLNYKLQVLPILNDKHDKPNTVLHILQASYYSLYNTM